MACNLWGLKTRQCGMLLAGSLVCRFSIDKAEQGQNRCLTRCVQAGASLWATIWSDFPTGQAAEQHARAGAKYCGRLVDSLDADPEGFLSCFSSNKLGLEGSTHGLPCVYRVELWFVAFFDLCFSHPSNSSVSGLSDKRMRFERWSME